MASNLSYKLASAVSTADTLHSACQEAAALLLHGTMPGTKRPRTPTTGSPHDTTRHDRAGASLQRAGQAVCLTCLVGPISARCASTCHSACTTADWPLPAALTHMGRAVATGKPTTLCPGTAAAHTCHACQPAPACMQTDAALHDAGIALLLWACNPAQTAYIQDAIGAHSAAGVSVSGLRRCWNDMQRASPSPAQDATSLAEASTLVRAADLCPLLSVSRVSSDDAWFTFAHPQAVPLCQLVCACWAALPSQADCDPASAPLLAYASEQQWVLPHEARWVAHSTPADIRGLAQHTASPLRELLHLFSQQALLASPFSQVAPASRHSPAVPEWRAPVGISSSGPAMATMTSTQAMACSWAREMSASSWLWLRPVWRAEPDSRVLVQELELACSSPPLHVRITLDHPVHSSAAVAVTSDAGSSVVRSAQQVAFMVAMQRIADQVGVVCVPDLLDCAILQGVLGVFCSKVLDSQVLCGSSRVAVDQAWPALAACCSAWAADGCPQTAVQLVSAVHALHIPRCDARAAAKRVGSSYWLQRARLSYELAAFCAQPGHDEDVGKDPDLWRFVWRKYEALTGIRRKLPSLWLVDAPRSLHVGAAR